jgi:hypothetical protein
MVCGMATTPTPDFDADAPVELSRQRSHPKISPMTARFTQPRRSTPNPTALRDAHLQQVADLRTTAHAALPSGPAAEQSTGVGVTRPSTRPRRQPDS